MLSKCIPASHEALHIGWTLLWTAPKSVESWYALKKIPLTPHILLHNISIWFSVYALFFKLNLSFFIILYLKLYPRSSDLPYILFFALSPRHVFYFIPSFVSSSYPFSFFSLFIPLFLLFFSLLWDSAFILPPLYLLYHFIMVSWIFLFLYPSDSQELWPQITLGGIYGFPGGSEVKASACNVGDLGLIPGSGRSPGEETGNPLQYSCLENPMEGEAWWTSHRVTKSQTRLSDFTFSDFLSFPGGTSGEEHSCQYRRHRFDPWVGKIPWRIPWIMKPGRLHSP